MTRLRPWLVVFGVVGALALARAQAPTPILRIVVPEPDSYVSGPIMLKARVDPPTAPVTNVSFFVNGRLVCQVEHPPFECPWNAGATLASHQIRVTAALSTGTRLVQTVRTKHAEYTESVDVDALWVTAVVTNDRGEFVRGLPRTAFRVLEDGIPQHITFFQSEDVPLELAAAVDVSGSMTDVIPQLKSAVRAFVGALKPTHKVTLLSFNDNIWTLARASVDPPARLKAIDRLAAWGGTSLYDVVGRAVDMLGKQVGRRALVVFSDGEDTASHITLETAEDRLQASDATIYTIAQGQAYRKAALRGVLERIAKTSGGRAFASENIETLAGSFNDILTELSNQYLLGYVPPNLKHDGAWHRITVEVTPKAYRVRAREGYRAPGGK